MYGLLEGREHLAGQGHRGHTLEQVALQQLDNGVNSGANVGVNTGVSGVVNGVAVVTPIQQVDNSCLANGAAEPLGGVAQAVQTRCGASC